MALFIRLISCFCISCGLFVMIYNKFNNDEILNINEEKTIQYFESDINDVDYNSVIEIPSINLKTIIYRGNKSMSSINKGVSFLYNTNMPDSDDLSIILGHTGNVAVSYFKNIHKLKKNDFV